MERRVKERLTGAAILVMLGVIFIPMILDDSSRMDTRIEETNIPPRPEGEFDARKAPRKQEIKAARETAAAAQQTAAETMTQTGGAESGSVSTSPEAADKVVTGEKEKAAKTTGAEKQTPVAVEKTTTAVLSNKDSKRPAPAAGGQESRGLKAWVVQIGSFSKEENAKDLVKQLQKSGYPAFVEPLKQDGDTIYRVRIGPELLRSDADALKEKLTREVKMEGIVLQYP